MENRNCSPYNPWNSSTVSLKIFIQVKPIHFQKGARGLPPHDCGRHASSSMPLRILIVDDFEKFRRYLCSALVQDRRFEIVGQACDGMEAVQKAAELKPDLVLLDVGLPKLNGVQVARQVRKVAHPAKILLISQEFSFDVVKAALRSGALGYIQKLNVARELLPGIEAVLAERYFVRGTVKQKFRETGGSTLRHEIQVYSDDAGLAEGFADFTATEL